MKHRSTYTTHSQAPSVAPFLLFVVLFSAGLGLALLPGGSQPVAGQAPTGRVLLPLIQRAPGFSAAPVGNGFIEPTTVTHAGDARLFVAERAGRIQIVHPDGRITTFLDIRDRVISNRGEYGFFDVAFHPDYAENGFFYVSYTSGYDFGERREVYFNVSRFRVTADPNVADPDSETRVMREKQSFDVHKGGGLDFDARNNLLYVGHGDDRLLLIAQDLGSPKGKIVRLRVDDLPAEVAAGEARTIPDEVWVMGLRNPWRFDVDEASDAIYIGEVGDLRWEEVNVAPIGARYFNFGWPCMEGPERIPEANDIPDCKNPNRFTPAVFQYPHRDGSGRCAVIGGVVYRPVWNRNDGRFIFGDMCTREVWALSRPGGVWTTTKLGTLSDLDLLTSLGEDYVGNVYATTGSGFGPVYRLYIP